jgi:hypothetical protein
MTPATVALLTSTQIPLVHVKAIIIQKKPRAKRLIRELVNHLEKIRAKNCPNQKEISDDLEEIV